MSLNLNELMATLAKAQDAVNAVPTLQSEVDKLRQALAASERENSTLRSNNENLGSELAKAKDAARSVGVERDEAAFRALELEEKLATVTDALGKTLGLVVPPKDEPKPDAEPAPVVAVKPDPEPEIPYAPASHSSSHDDWRDARDEEIAKMNEGTSIGSNPTPAPEVPAIPRPWEPIPEMRDVVPSGALSTLPPTSSTASASSIQPTPDFSKPYIGKAWHERPSHVSHSAWEAGGGEPAPSWMR